MNDPNGMFYKDGVWHLYYQWNPYGSQWENMTWGHSTSKDLIHWEAQPMAIEADWLGSIFSGSCVTRGDEVVAMYTSAGHHQTQSIAFSKDGGKTFQKYAGNPVLTTSDIADFRDPRPFWNEDIKAWNLILAAGQEMRIYSSKDLKDWKYESSFGKEYGNHGGVWECPDLFEIKNEKLNIKNWVLICNINPGGPFGGSATQYFVGQFDGKKFTCESMPKVTKWLDYGKDHYATVSFYNAPNNRRTVLAWMSNWQYANQVPTKQFRSSNSIPRDLGLFQHGEETYVSVVPSEEMLALRGAKVKNPTEACEILIDTKNQTEIVLSNTKGEQVTMTYDGQQQTFTMERVKSGDVSFSEAFPAVTVAPTFGTVKQLRIFIDRCSIEVFDAEGKMAMTNLVFPSEPYNNIKVKGGKATIYEMKNER
jgi:levanase/fructan beta-fructosidase